MTATAKLRTGDRVRITNPAYAELAGPVGTLGIEEGCCFVRFDGGLGNVCVDEDELELVRRPRRAKRNLKK